MELDRTLAEVGLRNQLFVSVIGVDPVSNTYLSNSQDLKLPKTIKKQVSLLSQPVLFLSKSQISGVNFGKIHSVLDYT